MDPIKHFKSIIEAVETRSEKEISQSVNTLKHTITKQVNSIPADSGGETLLHHIDDVLGGRINVVRNLIDPLIARDPNLKGKKAVKADKKRDDTIAKLSRFLWSLDMTRQDRDEFLELWRNDQLIDINLLLDTRSPHSLFEIVPYYNKNKVVKDITDFFIQESSYGVGKGETFLSLFSQRITSAKKGDITISTDRGSLNIELKTKDETGGPRFFDRDVRPSSAYLNSCDEFINKYRPLMKIPKAGINLAGLSYLLTLPDENLASVKSSQAKLTKSVLNILDMIFGIQGINYADNTQESREIVSALKSNDISEATRLYTNAYINKYLDEKRDMMDLEGILMFNLPDKTSFFFRDVSEAILQGTEFNPGTIYPISSNEIYTSGQIKPVDTNFSVLQKIQPTDSEESPLPEPTIDTTTDQTTTDQTTTDQTTVPRPAEGDELNRIKTLATQ